MEICFRVYNMSLDEVKGFLKQSDEWHGSAKDYNVVLFLKILFKLYSNFQGTNVVLTNGSQDPFSKLGMWEESWEKPGQRVVLMKG
jgi:hypothetical protein